MTKIKQANRITSIAVACRRPVTLADRARNASRLLPSLVNKAFDFRLHVAVIPCNMTAVSTVAIIARLQLRHGALAASVIAVTFFTSSQTSLTGGCQRRSN